MYASIAFPAWVLGVQPDQKILCIAGHRGLADEHHHQTHRLMTHDQYRGLFPHVRVGEAPGRIMLPQGGVRMALTPSGAITGRGADVIIIDDPQSAHDAELGKCKEICGWYDRNIYQRLNDKHDGVIIVVTQRLSADDLTAYLLKQEDWKVLSLPAIAIQDEYLPRSLGGKLARRKGEALHPARESREELRTEMPRMGARVFCAQYQQDPYPANKGDICHGVFHTALHPDASVDQCKYMSPWFGAVPEATFLLDELFGEPTDFRRGPPPALTTEEWIDWGESMATPQTEPESVREDLTLPCNDPTQATTPTRKASFNVRCEPCSQRDIEAMSKRSKGSWR